MIEAKTVEEEKLVFLSFCLEEYKTVRGMEGAAAARLFDKFGVTDYLTEHFDVLHTLSRAALLDDIGRFIEARRHKK